MWFDTQITYPVLTIVGGAALCFTLAWLFNRAPKPAHTDSGSVEGKRRRGTFN